METEITTYTRLSPGNRFAYVKKGIQHINTYTQFNQDVLINLVKNPQNILAVTVSPNAVVLTRSFLKKRNIERIVFENCGLAELNLEKRLVSGWPRFSTGLYLNPASSDSLGLQKGIEGWKVLARGGTLVVGTIEDEEVTKFEAFQRHESTATRSVDRVMIDYRIFGTVIRQTFRNGALVARNVSIHQKWIEDFTLLINARDVVGFLFEATTSSFIEVQKNAQGQVVRVVTTNFHMSAETNAVYASKMMERARQEQWSSSQIDDRVVFVNVAQHNWTLSLSETTPLRFDAYVDGVFVVSFDAFDASRLFPHFEEMAEPDVPWEMELEEDDDEEGLRWLGL